MRVYPGRSRTEKSEGLLRKSYTFSVRDLSRGKHSHFQEKKSEGLSREVSDEKKGVGLA